MTERSADATRLSLNIVAVVVLLLWTAGSFRVVGRFEEKFDRVIERLDNLEKIATHASDRGGELGVVVDRLKERMDDADRRRHAEWIYVHGRIDNHRWHSPTEQEN